MEKSCKEKLENIHLVFRKYSDNSNMLASESEYWKSANVDLIISFKDKMNRVLFYKETRNRFCLK